MVKIFKPYGDVSIHALREEGDPSGSPKQLHSWAFLSTPSARRATFEDFFFWCIVKFLSTPSARRATRAGAPTPQPARGFYPRPPRGGRLDTISNNSRAENAVSIHALREEGDGSWRAPALQLSKFLSTPSARRATGGGRLSDLPAGVSIHALREEGDVSGVMYPQFEHRFLSTPSARRATVTSPPVRWTTAFLSTPSARRATYVPNSTMRQWKMFLSTPSARRATLPGCSTGLPRQGFYPRPPRGGRRVRSSSRQSKRVFLSTPSARRATFFVLGSIAYPSISIHALREEGDEQPIWSITTHPYFYPRPPRGGRPLAVLVYCHIPKISIHALREEGDASQPAQSWAL